MNNSLYNAFAPKNNMSQLFGEIEQFKNSFKGDPKAEVEKMMQTGQLTQEQFNQYAMVANELVKYFK